MWELSQILQATVHQPELERVKPIDRLTAKLISQPQHWALSRLLSQQLDSDNTVFCTGEDIGIPLAILNRFNRNRCKLAMQVMEPSRIRVKNTIQNLGLAQSIDLFLTNTQAKAETLCRKLHVPDRQVFVLREQTDVQFFYPGAAVEKSRPIIACTGFEQRDYKTLAAATQNLDLDVKICAVSPNASKKTRVAFPDVMPSNMTPHPQEWQQFRQLYRNADIVVVSLLYNTYSAGLTSLMEAMACRRPVVITRTPGLASRLIDAGIVIGVAPEDAAGMQQAILRLLNNPEQAETLAQAGYDFLLKNHTSEQYMQDLVDQLQQLAATSEVSTAPAAFSPNQAIAPP
jgi:glycosyltransferase involved in cell wall biosynthesis